MFFFLLKIINAQFFGGYGGYGSFSITEIFDRFGAENIIYLSLFLIFFTFLFTVLNRVGIFRDHYGNPNTGSLTVISLSISLLITYGFYRSNYNIEDLFYNFGFSTDSLYPVILIAILALLVFIMWRFSVGILLMVLGILLALISIFTEIIYEKTTALIIAIVLFLIGLLLTKAGRRGVIRGGKWISGKYDWKKEKSQWRGRTHVLILGVLIFILGFILGQIYIIIPGIILTLIGIWLWYRKRPGLYRPLTPGYNPIQEKRQLKSGTPIFFLGALIVIFGFLTSQTTIIIIGAILAVIGLFLRMIR